MSQNLKVDTELLAEISRILHEANGDFEGARRRIAATLRVNLETGGQTEMGKIYAEGIRPGALATAALLDIIRDILEGAGGNTYGIATAFDAAAAAAFTASGKGGGGGGRR